MSSSSDHLNSVFANVARAPEDPILGVTVAYNKDPSPIKLNLGVGAYRTEEGKPLVLNVVRKAEQMLVNDQSRTKEYIPIIGPTDFNKLSAKLIFGAERVIENTKKYLCRAIVTVVDHLGSASANLDHQLSKTNSVSETEVRMNNLKQKLSTCQQYSHKLALSRLCWNADFPRYQPRYIMQPTPNLRRSNAILKESSDEPKDKSTISNQEVPLVSYKYKPFFVEDLSNVSKRISFSTPVQDSLVLQSKPQHRLFQLQEKHKKIKRRMPNWKPMENNDLISLIKWGKRTA